MPLHERQRPLAIRALHASLVMALAATLAGGCAQSSAPAKSSAQPDAKPSSLSEALAAFEESEDELQAFLRNEEKPAASDQFAQPGGDAPAQAAPPPMQQRETELSTAPRYHRNRCEQACDAYSSMRRSADRLCEMTGEDDQRCGNVRERVKAARETVHQACPACAAAG